jgi:dCMP deaminase
MKKFDKPMMETAFVWAKQSHCKRSKIGAVLAKDGRVLAVGYNGTLAGKDNNCEDYMLIKEGVKVNTDYYKSCKKNPDKYLITNHRLEKLEDLVDIYDKERLQLSPYVLDAEQNVLMFAARNGIITQDTTIYITKSPGKTSSKLIAQSGIKRVVFHEDSDDSGASFLKDCNIAVTHLKEL